MQFSGFLAEIVEINNKVKTGMYGEVYQVTCRILEGKDKGRIIRRNEIGPIKVGDVIRLLGAFAGFSSINITSLELQSFL